MADQNGKYTDIFQPGYSVTGIRSEDEQDTQVLMTGSCPIPNTQNTKAMLYRGPMNPTDCTVNPTDTSQCSCQHPNVPGRIITTSIFYGPDTWFSNPSIGKYNVRAVGTYRYEGDPLGPLGLVEHGMLYEGPLDGSVECTLIDMPNIKAGGDVRSTVPHSTMGDLIVGCYDLLTYENGKFDAFIYKINPNNPGHPDNYQKLTLEPYTFITAYGIWQNDRVDKKKTSYTIAGGLFDEDGINVGYLVDYDSETFTTSNLTLFPYSGTSNLITHFEGITDLGVGNPTQFGPQYYSLAATGDENNENRGAAFAVVERLLPSGTFNPQAKWQRVQDPNSTGLTTGNTVLTNNVFGIYKTGNGFRSYLASHL